MKMEWIDVNDRLPENGKEVLCLLSGYFPCGVDPLSQGRKHRVFQCSFYRNIGWNMPFSPNGCFVVYWMPLPEIPEE